MELIDALKVIEDQLRPGTGIGVWMMDDRKIIRQVARRDSNSFFTGTVEEWAADIEDAKASSPAILIEDFKGNLPEGRLDVTNLKIK